MTAVSVRASRPRTPLADEIGGTRGRDQRAAVGAGIRTSSAG